MHLCRCPRVYACTRSLAYVQLLLPEGATRILLKSLDLPECFVSCFDFNKYQGIPCMHIERMWVPRRTTAVVIKVGQREGKKKPQAVIHTWNTAMLVLTVNLACD